MTKSICCADLFPGCEFAAKADTEEALLNLAAEHAASVHGVTELTDEIVAKVKSAIRDNETQRSGC
ncbi:MAG: DUF1059 domain-containing protein [Alphaproteobacteria bacterium]|nr:DUF1059 domain-containing protein [Alphaproteobacteria bacterium]